MPAVEALASLADGSMVLALEYVDGRRLDELAPRGDRRRPPRRGMAPSRDAAPRLGSRPVPPRREHARGRRTARDHRPRLRRRVGDPADAGDRPRRTAGLAGRDRRRRAGVASARHGRSSPRRLAAAAPYFQPLALSAATRKQASKALLQDLRTESPTAPARSPPPLERLVRVRPRTCHDRRPDRRVLRAAPQLANVDDSFQALGHADGPGWSCASSCRWSPTSRRRSALPVASPNTCRSCPTWRRRWRRRS